LQAELTQSGDNFTPWFRLEWERLGSEFSAQLARHSGNV